MEDEVHRRIEALLAPHRGDVPSHRSNAWHGPVPADGRGRVDAPAHARAVR